MQATPAKNFFSVKYWHSHPYTQHSHYNFHIHLYLLQELLYLLDIDRIIQIFYSKFFHFAYTQKKNLLYISYWSFSLTNWLLQFKLVKFCSIYQCIELRNQYQRNFLWMLHAYTYLGLSRSLVAKLSWYFLLKKPYWKKRLGLKTK